MAKLQNDLSLYRCHTIFNCTKTCPKVSSFRFISAVEPRLSFWASDRWRFSLVFSNAGPKSRKGNSFNQGRDGHVMIQGAHQACRNDDKTCTALVPMCSSMSLVPISNVYGMTWPFFVCLYATYNLVISQAYPSLGYAFALGLNLRFRSSGSCCIPIRERFPGYPVCSIKSLSCSSSEPKQSR